MYIILQGSFDDTIHFEDVMPRNRRALEYTEEVRRLQCWLFSNY